MNLFHPLLPANAGCFPEVSLIRVRISPATASGQWHLTTSEVALGAAILVLVGSVVTLIVTNRATDRRDRRKLLTDIRTQRLNELYAPLTILLDQDARLSNRLRQGKGAAWHILDHVDEVLADAVDGPLAQAIVGINERIKTIIESKSGLLGTEIPPSFGDFLLHQDMLQRALAQQEYVHEVEAVVHFPGQFEVDVRQGYADVLDKLKRELSES